MRGIKAKEEATGSSVAREAFGKSKLDLNDLLARNKKQEIEDKKKNLLVLSLVTFLAVGVILILSFS